MAVGTTAPTTEIGHAGQTAPPWTYFQGDATEPPELLWPQSTLTYHRMRTDAQVGALQRSVSIPIRRLRWSLDPNGAKDEIVQQLSTDTNLPIKGSDDEVKRGRKRFNFDDHLRLALLAPLCYGHMPFEQVGIVDASLAWRLKKLAERLPTSIQEMNVARDGGLKFIRQWDTKSQASIFGASPPIPITQLVMYAWEREGDNWAGRSMLREVYRHWLLKDRLLRIDTIKNERFGAGIPTGTAPPGGSPVDYQKMAGATRATEKGGVGLPYGAAFGIQGVTGSLPDTLASIRYQDEAMARSFLAMFVQLGQTETGSRALGESFIDFFVEGLATFANWFMTIFNEHIIEDIVDWNWGEDEQAPLLTWDEREDTPLGVAELVSLIDSDALAVDDQLRRWILQRWRLPEPPEGEPLPPLPQPQPQPTVPLQVVAHGGGGHDQLSHGNRHSDDTQYPGEHTDHGMDVPQYSKTFLGSSQTVNDNRVGHREPTTVELAAKIDFNKVQKQWETATQRLVKAWRPIRQAQIDELVLAVEDAVTRNDFSALAHLSATVQGNDVVLEHMTDIAGKAVATALAEAKAQSIEIAESEVIDVLATLGPRSDAIAALLSRAISETAARQALLRYGAASALSPAEVAAGVREQLESLSDTYLNDQLGGALTQAQNTGRRAVMETRVADIYASELLDLNTCASCVERDGTKYTSTVAAEQDYPAGGNKNCAGGPRCRGTLVAIYDTEGQD